MKRRRLTFLDLRKQVETLRKNTSFRWVALRTADLSKKCSSCLNKDQYEVGLCKRCFNTGHAFVDKLVSAHSSLSIPGVDFSGPIGQANTKIQYFYIEHNQRPKNTDFILELDINEKTGVPRQPFRIIRAYKINDTNPLKGIDGRTEFWRCFVEERNYDLGKSILAKPHNRPSVTPTTVPALPGISQWELAIFSFENQEQSLPLSSDNTFPIITILGTTEELQLQPDASPPTGKLILTDIDGTDNQIDLEPAS